eukprot:Colp12_sorted_trinity150504_noHs@30060
MLWLLMYRNISSISTYIQGAVYITTERISPKAAPINVIALVRPVGKAVRSASIVTVIPNPKIQETNIHVRLSPFARTTIATMLIIKFTEMYQNSKLPVNSFKIIVFARRSDNPAPGIQRKKMIGAYDGSSFPNNITKKVMKPNSAELVKGM